MDCGVQQQSTTRMISVPPSSGSDAANQPLTSSFSNTDSDQAQFEADKRAVYKHPLFPLLALLFERCELATQSSDTQSSDAFNMDIQAFVQHQERDRKPFLANEPEIDGLMIKAIQVLRIHLLELEKVQELCKDFCNRYITCLKGKMQSENLLRSDYPQDVLGPGNLMNNLESNNNNSMMSHGGSDSGGSASTSPVQYSISPSQPQMVTSSSQSNALLETPSYSMVPQYTPPLIQPQQSCEAPLVVHGSTPLSQIGAGMMSSSCSASSPGGDGLGAPLSPAPTTPGGCNSADDCDSDITLGGRGTSGSGGGSTRKQKRGVLPKHATGVMRSWLFQHLVHPYPTEDEKRHIAAQTNLTLLQVNNWFINARRRILQPMLDASAPPEGATTNANNSSTSVNHKKKKNAQNNNRRFWPQDFAGGQMHQPQIDNVSGMLLSSDDDGDSFSSDGEDGGGGLIIDSTATTAESTTNQNGYNNGSSGGGGEEGATSERH